MTPRIGRPRGALAPLVWPRENTDALAQALAPVAVPDPVIVRAPVFVRDPATWTLTECIGPFLEWLRLVRGLSPLTLYTYAGDCAQFAEFARRHGVVRPAGVTHQLVEFHIMYVQGHQGRKPATALKRLYALRTFFKFLLRQGLTTRNPAADSLGRKDDQKARVPACPST